ncbi:hypothetical protein ATCV1_z250R [Acanthocystis turfacea chlorella virus 1]|uniref:Uncharacterized protein z250R n=1 Tax=Chlorovirus heliozoae TaxID=322019 RepID=A7K8L0_9PHYC|nr:hypothetical protein ATCV1_z250R [Acanthocystis turfacea chlorella virus 1]ABT16384.1 hypothetical protein ATCV1_z250R [Acanthocystis turfacea chlorella virus 1]
MMFKLVWRVSANTVRFGIFNNSSMLHHTSSVFSMQFTPKFLYFRKLVTLLNFLGMSLQYGISSMYILYSWLFFVCPKRHTESSFNL